MAVKLIFITFSSLLHISNGLGGIKMNCPGNQLYVLDAEVCMATCGRPDPWNDLDHPFSECPRSIYGGCRCPADEPFLMDDGVTCTANCPLESTRLCPGNQEWGFALHDVQTCMNPIKLAGDMFFEGCTCGGGRLLDIDGYTCVRDQRKCSPICPVNQWLNLVDGKPCTRTCEFRDPPCDDFLAQRCECPDDAPYLSTDGVTCLTAQQCDAPVTVTTVAPPAPPDTYCQTVSEEPGTTSSLSIDVTEGPGNGKDASNALAGSGRAMGLGPADKLRLESDCTEALPTFISFSMRVKNVEHVHIAVYDVGDELVDVFSFPIDDPRRYNFVQLIPGVPLYSFYDYYDFSAWIPGIKRLEIEFTATRTRFQVKDVTAAFCCGDVLSTTSCPGNQVHRVVQASGFGGESLTNKLEWPDQFCTKTCRNPDQIVQWPFQCDFDILTCACPDDASTLHADGVMCIEEKHCPLPNCLGNQVWTPHGMPCDFTCNVDESDTTCSIFNAYKCACPHGTYLDARDGVTCTDFCFKDCPARHSRLDLVYGVQYYTVRMIPTNDSSAANRALIGSGKRIAIFENQRYRILQRDMFLTRHVCFTSLNVQKVWFNYYGEDERKPSHTEIREINSKRPTNVCSDVTVNSQMVDIKFEARESGIRIKLWNLELKACVPSTI